MVPHGCCVSSKSSSTLTAATHNKHLNFGPLLLSLFAYFILRSFAVQWSFQNNFNLTIHFFKCPIFVPSNNVGKSKWLWAKVSG